MEDLQIENIKNRLIVTIFIWIGMLIIQSLVALTYGEYVWAQAISPGAEVLPNFAIILLISIVLIILGMISFILLLFDSLSKKEHIGQMKAIIIMGIVSAFLTIIQMVFILLTYTDVFPYD